MASLKFDMNSFLDAYKGAQEGHQQAELDSYNPAIEDYGRVLQLAERAQAEQGQQFNQQFERAHAMKGLAGDLDSSTDGFQQAMRGYQQGVMGLGQPQQAQGGGALDWGAMLRAHPSYQRLAAHGWPVDSIARQVDALRAPASVPGAPAAAAGGSSGTAAAGSPAPLAAAPPANGPQQVPVQGGGFTTGEQYSGVAAPPLPGFPYTSNPEAITAKKNRDTLLQGYIDRANSDAERFRQQDPNDPRAKYAADRAVALQRSGEQGLDPNQLQVKVAGPASPYFSTGGQGLSFPLGAGGSANVQQPAVLDPKYAASLSASVKAALKDLDASAAGLPKDDAMRAQIAMHKQQLPTSGLPQNAEQAKALDDWVKGAQAYTGASTDRARRQEDIEVTRLSTRADRLMARLGVPGKPPEYYTSIARDLAEIKKSPVLVKNGVSDAIDVPESLDPTPRLSASKFGGLPQAAETKAGANARSLAAASEYSQDKKQLQQAWRDVIAETRSPNWARYSPEQRGAVLSQINDYSDKLGLPKLPASFDPTGLTAAEKERVRQFNENLLLRNQRVDQGWESLDLRGKRDAALVQHQKAIEAAKTTMRGVGGQLSTEDKTRLGLARSNWNNLMHEYNHVRVEGVGPGSPWSTPDEALGDIARKVRLQQQEIDGILAPYKQQPGGGQGTAPGGTTIAPGAQTGGGASPAVRGPVRSFQGGSVTYDGLLQKARALIGRNPHIRSDQDAQHFANQAWALSQQR